VAEGQVIRFPQVTNIHELHFLYASGKCLHFAFYIMALRSVMTDGGDATESELNVFGISSGRLNERPACPDFTLTYADDTTEQFQCERPLFGL
jgi:hypothetical protein